MSFVIYLPLNQHFSILLLQCFVCRCNNDYDENKHPIFLMAVELLYMKYALNNYFNLQRHAETFQYVFNECVTKMVILIG